MRTARLFLLCSLLVPLAARTAAAQTNTWSALRHFVVELALVQDANDAVSALRAEATEAGQSGRLRCIDDRGIYLSGLELAVRIGIDEYAVAHEASDEPGMRRAARRIATAAERAPLYLAEAEACTELVGAKLREECSDRPGEACTRWTVRVDFDHEYDEYGGFGAGTVPHLASSHR